MEIKVFSDFSEEMQYNINDFPLYVRINKLSHFGYWGACHWHSGVEIVSILDGTMDFFINGQIVTLLPKSILLVNSKRMHYGFSDTKDECTFIDMIVEPSLFDSSCSSIQKQIDNSFGRSSEDYLLFDCKSEAAQELASAARIIHGLMSTPKPNMIDVQVECMKAMSKCIKFMGHSTRNTEHTVNNQEIWKMVDYIHRHYFETVQIDNIADAGKVSRTRCFNIFRNYLAQTPTEYLTRYRLDISLKLLAKTDMSVKEISSNSGFQSVSYYCATFKRLFGCTPLEYQESVSNKK